MKYLTHDNYSRPFSVVIANKKATISNEHTGAVIATYPVVKSWIGTSSGRKPHCDHKPSEAKQFYGNSILIQISAKKYVYIGEEVREFSLASVPVHYHSPIGNNDVPYPVIVTDKDVIFMLDMVSVPRSIFIERNETDDWEGVYGDFYRLTGYKPKKVVFKKIHGRNQ